MLLFYFVILCIFIFILSFTFRRTIRLEYIWRAAEARSHFALCMDPLLTALKAAPLSLTSKAAALVGPGQTQLVCFDRPSPAGLFLYL